MAADNVERTSETLDPFRRRRTVVLTTFKRDGTSVSTPVTIAVEGEHAFIRTYDQGIVVPLFHRIKRYRTLHYEVEPISR